MATQPVLFLLLLMPWGGLKEVLARLPRRALKSASPQTLLEHVFVKGDKLSCMFCSVCVFLGEPLIPHR